MLDISIFDLFDAVDDNGYYSGSVHPCFTSHKQMDGLKRDDLARHLVNAHLMNMRSFTFIFDRVKKTIKDQEVSATVDDQGLWTLSLNLAKFFRLPGLRPVEELAELRKFFEAIQDFITTKAPHRAGVQLTNNRDNKGRVYGELRAWVDAPTDPGDGTDPMMTTRLEDMVKASSVLQAFLRNSALALQKIGPWSWDTFDENLLFGKDKGPHYAHRISEIRAQMAAEAGR